LPSLLLSNARIASPNPGYKFFAFYPILANNLISPFEDPTAKCPSSVDVMQLKELDPVYIFDSDAIFDATPLAIRGSILKMFYVFMQLNT